MTRHARNALAKPSGFPACESVAASRATVSSSPPQPSRASCSPLVETNVRDRQCLAAIFALTNAGSRLTLSSLALEMGVNSKSEASRVVTRLRQKGLLTRDDDAALMLLPGAHALISSVHPKISEAAR
jgi:hypothetical protein